MKKRVLSMILTIVMTAGLLAGCGSEKAAADTAKEAEAADETAEEAAEEAEPAEEAEEESADGELVVHLGDQPSFFILKIADYLGYFEEEFADSNVTISVDNFVNQGSAIIEAMSAGDVQVGVVGSLPLVAAVANDNPFIAISCVNYSENGFKLMAKADSGVSEVADFAGKKVAVKFSSNEHQMTLTLLKNAGLDTSDVEVVNMSAEDSLSSLLSGDVDGALLKGDQLNAALEGGAVIIADNSESGIISNFLIAREEFAAEHPEVIEGILRVLDKTKKWIDENEEETVDIFVSLTNTEKAAAQTSFESRDRSISIDADKFTDPIQQTIDFSLEQGLIDTELTLEDIVDTSYFENTVFE